jgi:hypothetical protein
VSAAQLVRAYRYVPLLRLGESVPAFGSGIAMSPLALSRLDAFRQTAPPFAAVQTAESWRAPEFPIR